MRKCEKCGREIEEWSICPCSQQNEFYYSQNEFSSAQPDMNLEPEAFVIDSFNAPKSKNKSLFPILGVLLIAIVGFICFRFLEDDSYKEPLDNLCLIFNTKEDDPKMFFDKLVPGYIGDVIIGIIDTFSTNGDILSTMDEATNSFADIYQQIESDCGNDFTVTYKVKSKHKMSKTDLEQCKAGMNRFYTASIQPSADVFREYDANTLATYMGGSPQQIEKLISIYDKAEESHNNLEISEGYSLTVEFKFKGSKGVSKSKSNLNVIKVNGEWTFDYFSTGNGNSISIDSIIE